MHRRDRSGQQELALNPLVFKIADTSVLIGVKPTDREPELMYTDVGDTLCAVAYTDPDEIRQDLPDGYRLFQITVPELLGACTQNAD